MWINCTFKTLLSVATSLFFANVYYCGMVLTHIGNWADSSHCPVCDVVLCNEIGIEVTLICFICV